MNRPYTVKAKQSEKDENQMNVDISIVIPTIEKIVHEYCFTHYSKHCELKSFNNDELDFNFYDGVFNFEYENIKLDNIDDILNFVKKHGTKEDYFKAEKFIFECI